MASIIHDMSNLAMRIRDNIQDMVMRWHASHHINSVMFIVTILSILAMASFVFSTSQSVDSEYATSPTVTDSHSTDVHRSDDAMVNIYLFWGDGCKHCKALMATLDNIAKRHPGVFRIYGLETWHDDDNESLVESYSNKLGLADSKVPLLIIGDKIFQGYDPGTNVDSQIEEAIMSEYGRLVRDDLWQYE